MANGISGGFDLIIGGSGSGINTISGVIGTGSGSVFKTGASTWVLSGANTFTGTLVISGGVLVARSANALGAGSSPIIVRGDTTVGGGALMLASGGMTGFTLARDISLSGYGPATAQSSQGSGFLAPQAALVSIGNNTVSGVITPSSLSSARIYSDAGLLNLSNAGLALTTAAFNMYLGSGATNSTLANNISVTSLISGGASGQVLGKTGVGTVILSNPSNSFANYVQIDGGGYLRVDIGGQLGTSTATNAINLNGGVLDIRSDSPTGFSGKGVATNGQNNSLFVSRAPSGTAINQQVQFGDVRINNASYTLTINGRDGFGVTFGSGASTVTLPSSGNSSFTNASNGLLNFNNSFTTTETTARAFTLTATGEIQVTGNLLGSGSPHSWSKAGSGQLTLNGNAGTFSGNFNANAGTTVIYQFGALNNPATGSGGTGGALNLGSTTTSASLNYLGASGTGAGETVNKVVNLAGTTGNAYLLANQTGSSPTALVIANAISAGAAGAKTLFLGGNSAASVVNQISGVIIDNATTSVTKVGTGTWLYTPAASSYSTPPTGVTVSSGGAAQTNSVVVSNAAGLVVGQTISGTNIPTGAVITGISGSTVYFSGAISTAVAASTALTFGATAGFAGALTIAGGTFKLTPTAATGNGSDLINNTTGALIFDADKMTSA
ncbi:MAG: hypothetical protein EBS01_11185, partial [Verrucomicrobia bacterium]|nr:hypothetical protein [Verrucomicrobiota bacterium]